MIGLTEALGHQIQFEGSVYDILYPKTGTNANAPWSIIRVALGVNFQSFPLYDGAINRHAPVGIGGFVVVKGHIPALSPSNIVYRFTVVLENSEKYGYSYNFVALEEIQEATNLNQQLKTLSHILTEHKLKLLLENSSDPIALLEAGDVNALSQIRGIGPRTAETLVEQYKTRFARAKEEVDFYDYGLSKLMIDKIVAFYGSPDKAKAIIKTNPYRLITDLRGIGWAKADAIAQRGGLGLFSKERITAYVYYYLDTLANTEGHTWVTLPTLGAAIKEVAPGIEDELIIKYLEEMIVQNRLFFDVETNRIGLALYRRLEEHIAQELKRLESASVTPLHGIEEAFAEAERETGYIYTQEQKDAVLSCINNPICLITGTAGTGKSSIMLPFTKILHKNHLNFQQVALSGKAALNLTEITKETGMTIHKLLLQGHRMVDEEDMDIVTENDLKEIEPMLPLDVVILDELSMVGGNVFYKLIKRLKTGARLVLLGDPGQLESIGLCNLIKDIEDSHTVASVHLNKIHRQAALSGIVTEATKVYNQQPIVPKNFSGELVSGEKRDFKIITAEDVEECASTAITWYFNFVNFLHATPDEICVVVAKRAAGAASARCINEQIQQHLNLGPEYIQQSYTDSGINYYIQYHCGDRILVTKNNYHVVDINGEECPIFNGNLGTVKEINRATQGLVVEFPQGTVVLTNQNLSAIQLGYAITCHKMQGSGVPYVIYICDPSAYTLLSKEHLYTGITRAKKLCIVIGRAYTINFATSTTRVKTKQTWLKELLMT